MFARGFFAGRYFPPTYFPPVSVVAAVATDTHDGFYNREYWWKKRRKSERELLKEVKQAYEAIVEGKLEVPETVKQEVIAASGLQKKKKPESVNWEAISRDGIELERIAASLEAALILASGLSSLAGNLSRAIAVRRALIAEQERQEMEDDDITVILLTI